MGLGQVDYTPYPAREMTNNMVYSTSGQYLPPQYYPTPSYPTHSRQEPSLLPMMHTQEPTPAPRKRPKYSRSKTGCLTCRVKKVKCDERKPTCLRCQNGQRDCAWPEGVAIARGLSSSRAYTVDGFDSRPSTAGSSNYSETSTPPPRNASPFGDMTTHVDMNLAAHVGRMSSEPFMQINQMAQQQQQQMSSNQSSRGPPVQNYPVQHHSMTDLSAMSTVPEAIPFQRRYEANHSRIVQPPSVRGPITDVYKPHNYPVNPQSINQWNPSIMSSLEQMESFYLGQERNLMNYAHTQKNPTYQ